MMKQLALLPFAGIWLACSCGTSTPECTSLTCLDAGTDAGLPRGTLSFTVAESLLVLNPDAPSFGFVLLSSATGNCAAVQANLSFFETDYSRLHPQVSNVSYLLIDLEHVLTDNDGALFSGTYTVIPGAGGATVTDGELIATAYEVTTNASCGFTSNGDYASASSGTVTMDPFNTMDGGSSILTYSVALDGTQVSNTNVLTTCLVSFNVAEPDAGACVSLPCGPCGG